MKPNRIPSKKLGARNPTVNPTEQRKLFLALAGHLRRGGHLTGEQAQYLAVAFERIGRGESADEALNLKRGKGQSARAEQRRRTMSLVFLQVANYMASEKESAEGHRLSLQEAMLKVIPLARELFGPLENPDSYSIEYLMKCWHDPSYAHMRTTIRTQFDPDSPLGIS